MKNPLRRRIPIPCLKMKLHLLCQRPNICGAVGLAIDVTIVFGLFRGKMMNLYVERAVYTAAA